MQAPPETPAMCYYTLTLPVEPGADSNTVLQSWRQDVRELVVNDPRATMDCSMDFMRLFDRCQWSFVSYMSNPDNPQVPFAVFNCITTGTYARDCFTDADIGLLRDSAHYLGGYFDVQVMSVMGRGSSVRHTLNYNHNTEDFFSHWEEPPPECFEPPERREEELLYIEESEELLRAMEDPGNY